MSLKICKYSELNPVELRDIYRTLNPSNNNLYPSVVLSWSNENNAAIVVTGDNKWLLGHLYPVGWSDFWTLSSKEALSLEEIDQVISITKNLDPDVTTIKYITPETLGVVMRTEHPHYDIVDQGDDSANYLYDLQEISACQGSKFSDMRRYAKAFKTYRPTLKELSFEDTVNMRKDIFAFHTSWVETGKTDGSKMTDYELGALQKFFDNNTIDKSTVLSYAIYADNVLIGLTINEQLPDGYVLNHYFKASSSHKGAGVYLFLTTAKMLAAKNATFLNYQEDLGIPGLRAFKEKMRPIKKAHQLLLQLQV